MDNDLESFLSVEDIGKKDEHKRDELFDDDEDKSYNNRNENRDKVDEFLELD